MWPGTLYSTLMFSCHVWLLLTEKHSSFCSTTFINVYRFRFLHRKHIKKKINSRKKNTQVTKNYQLISKLWFQLFRLFYWIYCFLLFFLLLVFRFFSAEPDAFVPESLNIPSTTGVSLSEHRHVIFQTEALSYFFYLLLRPYDSPFLFCAFLWRTMKSSFFRSIDQSLYSFLSLSVCKC